MEKSGKTKLKNVILLVIGYAVVVFFAMNVL